MEPSLHVDYKHSRIKRRGGVLRNRRGYWSDGLLSLYRTATPAALPVYNTKCEPQPRHLIEVHRRGLPPRPAWISFCSRE